MTTSAARDIEAVARVSAVPNILQVVTEATGMRFAVIARVTATSWTACAVRDELGLGLRIGDVLDVGWTLCSRVQAEREPIIIEQATNEPQYCRHPALLHFRLESYIAMPIILKSGEIFGTLCAMDIKPAELRETKIVGMMKLFTELLAAQLEAEDVHAQSAAALAEARVTAELREQFIAVLGHDLRNPLSSIAMGAQLLSRHVLADVPRMTVERIGKSARRIELLVNAMLDLARGRLAGGMTLETSRVPDLEAPVRHLIDEITSSHPNRSVRLSVEGNGQVVCDRQRIEQLVSNLVTNAIDHSDGKEPVDVVIRLLPDKLSLTVHNSGTPIRADVLPRLFHPFYRGSEGEPQKGLGLGLFIVSEIARAHGGSVRADSSAREGTTFTVTLPREPRDVSCVA
ncbi:Sensor histidine kinase [Labilithrix luteola]|uniref:histidine kinase n=1 Tax=Labilithrix luteola TaxID=1391654 RepID=A0A0K1PNV0_9BACT|nr:GAF domain-containing sensor histidine kinase [Labilithrix luteola]AKU94784.1 Sensor histidine kinase [Labilithrix luteola]